MFGFTAWKHLNLWRFLVVCEHYHTIDHASSPRPPLPPFFFLTIPKQHYKKATYTSQKNFSEWKQTHVGCNPKKPTKLDGNDTTTLSHDLYILCHFVTYKHHKTLYMHLAYTKYSALLTQQSSFDSYLPCSAAIKFHNITSIPTDHIRTVPTIQTHALHSFCIQARQTISAMLSIAITLYIAATRNINHSPCTSTCTPGTTHAPHCLPQPSAHN